MPLEPKEPAQYIRDEEYVEAPFSDLEERLDELIRLRESRLSSKILKIASSIANFPFKAISNYALEKRLDGLTKTAGFVEFENKLSRYAEEKANYKSVSEYLDALLIADQLAAGLDAVGYKLPDSVKTIDVGCGRTWFYACVLYNFLQNHNTIVPREIELHGIDLLATKETISEFNRSIKGKNIIFKRGDVLDMDGKNSYDLIFTHKMLTSPTHYKKWRIKPRDVEQILIKCSDMLKPGGIHFVSNFEQAGEYSRVAEMIPPKRRIAELGYQVDVGNPNLNALLTPGIDRVYRSGICICRK